MALVRISNELLNEVENKITSMQHRELSNYPGLDRVDIRADDSRYAESVEAVVASTWSAAPHLRSQMPKEWCARPGSIDVIYTDGDRETGKHTITFIIRVCGEVALPPRFSSYPSVCVDRNTHPIPWVETLLTNVGENLSKRAEIEHRYGIIREQVIKFIRSQKSLNAALKAHPELALYVKQNRIDKVNEKVERNRSTTGQDDGEEITLDINAITAAAIAHRIAQAGGVA